MRWLKGEEIEQRVYQTSSFACVVGKMMGVSGMVLLTLAPGPFVFGLFSHLEGPTALQTASLMAVGLLSVCMSVMTLLSPAETDWNGER